MVTVDWYLVRFNLFRLWLWLTRQNLCPACHGHGRTVRLDAGVMRRFGMKWWEECEACGGVRDRHAGKDGCGIKTRDRRVG